MGISIDEINVETVGPISELQLELGPFNLIYGGNELGKTFLVEFVVRALFKNLAGWSLRDSSGRGKVVVSGLADEPLSLVASSGTKLEDYFDDDGGGLPSRISRLLVVKGAELSFEDGKRPGISKEILKEYLSGQGVLDDIQESISKTVQGAKVEDEEIDGYNMGEIKRRSELAETLKQVDELFAEIETIYSGGERQALQDKAQELEAQVEEQKAAKRHHAYQMHEQIKERAEQLDRLPEQQLNELGDAYRDLQKTQNRIERNEQRLRELEQESEHYEWLDEAITLYEQRGTQAAEQSNTVYLLAIVLLLLLAIISSLFGFSAGTIFFIVMAAVVGWLFWRRQQAVLARAVDTDEMRKLRAEYENRFGESLTGLPQMKAKKKAMEKAYHGAEAKRGEIDKEKRTLESLREAVASRLRVLKGEKVDPGRWEQVIQELRDRRQKLVREISDLETKQAVLGVAEEEYREQPATIDYSPSELQRLEKRLEEVQENLREKTGALDNLKQRISLMTQDEISIDWETLIQNLQKKRQDVAEAYRAVTAEILAGIKVNEILDEVRAREDEKIRDRLASPLVKAPIRQITGRYTGVRYEEGQVWAVDAHGRFRISDLSTGAREQVLLGLRLGFAAQIFGADRLFLLLDDAFQHADWQRREWLLDQTIALAKDGWQIIYFTMDDHIRELFDAAGREHFPDGYQYHELGA